MNVQGQSQQSDHALWVLALGYLFFVVYGSLLPFEFKPVSFSGAWDRFQAIPWLQLGVEHRADWVANLLLYIPLGFFVCGLLVGRSRRSAVLLIGLALAWIFGSLVAAGVEFLQIFFPQRTFSLNDLYAEIFGTLLGAALWLFFGARLQNLFQAIQNGGKNARYALLLAYALAYVALALFPYDFLLSFDEWHASVARKAGWFFSPTCTEHCWLKLLAEALVVSPLGALAFGSRRSSLAAAAVAGLVVGILIELMQLTIASGISQGMSVLSRGVGFALGAGAMRFARHTNWQWLRPWVRPATLIGLIPYVLLAAWANHWFVENWLDLQAGMGRLPGTHFMPFYYHYFSSETTALVSLLRQFGLYFPVGIAVWGWRWAGRTQQPTRTWILPTLWGTAIASVIETGKLFIASQHPDPTNILIAAVASLAAYRSLHLLCRVPTSSPAVIAISHEQPLPETDLRRPLWAMLLGVLGLGGATVAAITSPLGAEWVLPPLVLYVALLWRWPGWWLVAVLGALPLLDLTPWSGRLFWTEYDTLLLATIGVGYFNLRSDSSVRPQLRRTARVLLGLFSASALISVGIGLWPLETLDLNSFTRYTSSFNALRAAKGLMFALLFIPLLSREWVEPARAARRLAGGVSLALAATVLYVLWERVTFSGLFNFDSVYRITGPFPGMHTGGAYIEGFLVIALPFLALWAWQQRRIGSTLLAAGLYGLGAYSVMVTFSRGGQAAFAVATLILLFGFIRLALGDRVRRATSVGVIVLITGLAAAVAWPVFTGAFSQARLATTEQDVSTRTAHWNDAWQILQKHDATIYGLGLGSFPAAYFWGTSEASRPSTYAFLTEQGNTFTRLGSGETLYFEQQVALVAAQRYTLGLNLRASDKQATLTAPVCEKALLYSFTCVWATFKITAPPGQWAHYETQIDAQNFGPPGSRFSRPIKLSLYTSHAGTLVDVDNVTLRDAAGINLVRNGDFSKGMDYWFFSTDSHLSWHVKNLFLHILFEQGWIGLLCFVALIAYAVGRWLPRAWHGDPLSLTLCASFAPFLIVGMVDSLVDETRVAFLFYLLLLAGLYGDARIAKSRHRFDKH